MLLSYRLWNRLMEVCQGNSVSLQVRVLTEQIQDISAGGLNKQGMALEPLILAKATFEPLVAANVLHFCDK